MKKTLLPLAAAALATTVSHAALVDGLVNYWNFDDNLTDHAHGLTGAASTVQDDGFFAGANGAGGIDFSLGLFGPAISQDGSVGPAQNNGFVEVPRSGDTLFGVNTAHTANTLSTSIWINDAVLETNWQSVISHGEGRQYRIARRADTNFAGYAGGVGEGPVGTANITNNWQHIVAISDGVAGNTRLYVNGVLDSTGGVPVINDAGNGSAPGGTTPNLNIGANPQTGAQNREWNGLLDDAAQWNRVLTDTEIAQLYGGGWATAQPLSTLLIPEPSSSLLGLLSLGLILRRRR